MALNANIRDCFHDALEKIRSQLVDIFCHPNSWHASGNQTWHATRRSPKKTSSGNGVRPTCSTIKPSIYGISQGRSRRFLPSVAPLKLPSVACHLWRVKSSQFTALPNALYKQYISEQSANTLECQVYSKSFDTALHRISKRECALPSSTAQPRSLSPPTW